MTTDRRAKREQVTRDGLAKAPAGRASGDVRELPEEIRVAVDAIEEHKGRDLLVLDLHGLASFADIMVICSGRNERQVQAVADAVVEQLEKRSVEPLHTEGYEQGNWVLIDYVDFLINVFIAETRDYYQLERIWRDAPVLVGERSGRAGASEDVGDAETPEEPTTGSD